MKKLLLTLSLAACFLFASPLIAKADGDAHDAGYKCQPTEECSSSGGQTNRAMSGGGEQSSDQSANSSVKSAILYLLITTLPKAW